MLMGSKKQKFLQQESLPDSRGGGGGGIFFALFKYTFVLTNNNYFETDS